jgi:hypothetical protein
LVVIKNVSHPDAQLQQQQQLNIHQQTIIRTLTLKPIQCWQGEPPPPPFLG